MFPGAQLQVIGDLRLRSSLHVCVIPRPVDVIVTMLVPLNVIVMCSVPLNAVLPLPYVDVMSIVMVPASG